MQRFGERQGDGREQRHQWAFTFAVDGDLRFISHRDTLRLFQRALARASLPVRHSEGFNPHPRLSLPLPRPVGMASEAELIIVEFCRPVDGDEARDRLARHMPEGIRMITARRVEGGTRLRPVLVRYRLDAADQPPGALESRVRQVRATTVLAVERVNPTSGERRTIDAKPYLAELRAAGPTVEFSLRVAPAGGVKPAEIAGLLGYEPRAVNHLIRRLEVQWE